MPRLFVLLALALTGCSLYFETGDDSPDAFVGNDAFIPPDAVPFLDAPVPSDECGFVTCGPGTHCQAQCAEPGTDSCPIACHVSCVPDQSCDEVNCGPNRTCVEPCIYDCTGFAWVCNQSCERNGNAGLCMGDVTCNQPAPPCPSGTRPGIRNGCWSNYCIPQGQCGNTDPGSCRQGTVICESLPPQCPPPMIPGVRNGCWSGYCIPPRGCPCETLDTEAACLRHPECAPIYDGEGCNCTGNTCSCADPHAAFERCRAL